MSNHNNRLASDGNPLQAAANTADETWQRLAQSDRMETSDTIGAGPTDFSLPLNLPSGLEETGRGTNMSEAGRSTANGHSHQPPRTSSLRRDTRNLSGGSPGLRTHQGQPRGLFGTSQEAFESTTRQVQSMSGCKHNNLRPKDIQNCHQTHVQPLRFKNMMLAQLHLMTPCWRPLPGDYGVPREWEELEPFVTQLYKAMLDISEVFDEEQNPEAVAQFLDNGKWSAYPEDVEAISHLLVSGAINLHCNGAIGLLFRRFPYNRPGPAAFDSRMNFAQRIWCLTHLLKHYKQYADAMMRQWGMEDLLVNVYHTLWQDTDFVRRISVYQEPRQLHHEMLCLGYSWSSPSRAQNPGIPAQRQTQHEQHTASSATQHQRPTPDSLSIFVDMPQENESGNFQPQSDTVSRQIANSQASGPFVNSELDSLQGGLGLNAYANLQLKHGTTTFDDFLVVPQANPGTSCQNHAQAFSHLASNNQAAPPVTSAVLPSLFGGKPGTSFLNGTLELPQDDEG